DGAALSAVERREGEADAALLRADEAQVVAGPGVLDLVDLGPQIAQDERGEGARDEARQIEDADPGERPRGGRGGGGHRDAISPEDRRASAASSRASGFRSPSACRRRTAASRWPAGSR